MEFDLDVLLQSRTHPVEVLALGTPAPGEPAFPRLRNQIFARLAERGFRSIAVECDRAAGLAVDAYVRGAGGTLDDVLAAGRGFGGPAADRELVEWMRAYNESVPPDERLAFHGFDALRESTTVPEPATGRTSPPAGARDVGMARNLLDVRSREERRGPTLVFGHTRHLRRHPGPRPAGADVDPSAGAIVADALGRRYALVVFSLGASAALRLAAPADDTFEGVLGAATGQGPVFAAGRLAELAGPARVRTDAPADQDYLPLAADTLADCDAVWHVDRFPAAAAAVAARIRELPGVTEQQAGPETPAPEAAWDERFFFAGSERRRPFATMVGHDSPGFDEESRLDRAGVYRLNIELGRAAFEEEFGYPPREFAEHRAGIDFALLDVVVPHPVYAAQGWACVVNPGAASSARVERLLASAHQRAVEREQRRAQRG
ncbi:Erythromycin esterase [Micromonospora citrea]|uniref:Erythromycin esterase n=1 Tax=Micromonospora citrea TaxID=47855 RepID=A0A1C6UIR5_9ACTN|nr:DUF6194 family protein [Micromonospora citrea]SCL53854.1 Erythromycin esterase [Micromonospora citrea]